VLLTVLNDILDFSKIEAGKLELDYVRLSPRRLCCYRSWTKSPRTLLRSNAEAILYTCLG